MAHYLLHHKLLRLTTQRLFMQGDSLHLREGLHCFHIIGMLAWSWRLKKGLRTHRD